MSIVYNIKSTEYSNATATPIVPSNPSLASSKIRIQPVTWACPAGGVSLASTMLFARMPAGNVTIFTGLSKLYNNVWATNTTLAIGYGVYYTPTTNPPASVVALAAAFRAAATLHTAGSFNLDTVDLYGIQTFYSLTGFDVTGLTAAENLSGSETLQGFICYTID